MLILNIHCHSRSSVVVPIDVAYNDFLLVLNINLTYILNRSWDITRFTPIHCVSVVTFKLSVTLSNLNWFSKFFHCGKHIKFATTPIRHYPPHLRHVVTLLWEIKNSNSNFLQITCRYGRKCKQISFYSPITLIFIWCFRS